MTGWPQPGPTTGDSPGGGSIASILVTAGPTHEYLDDVRYLSNGSSGRMGYALAQAAVAAGHRVVLVSGPTALTPPRGAELRSVTSALEMQAAVDAALGDSAATIDLVVCVAAVADYRPAERQPGKPAKAATDLSLRLVPNPDILAGLGQRKAAGELSAVLVGFALEAGTPAEMLARARAKLQRKVLDLCVANRVGAMHADDNEVTLVFADGRTQALPRQDKTQLAERILEAALGILTQIDNKDGTDE